MSLHSRFHNSSNFITISDGFLGDVGFLPRFGFCAFSACAVACGCFLNTLSGLGLTVRLLARASFSIAFSATASGSAPLRLCVRAQKPSAGVHILYPLYVLRHPRRTSCYRFSAQSLVHTSPPLCWIFHIHIHLPAHLITCIKLRTPRYSTEPSPPTIRSNGFRSSVE